MMGLSSLDGETVAELARCESLAAYFFGRPASARHARAIGGKARHHAALAGRSAVAWNLFEGRAGWFRCGASSAKGGIVSTSTKSSACLGTHQSCVFEQGCEEVAPAYVFLASEADSSYITGELLPVIGGMPYGS
jgi:hypothetical protein